MGVLSYPRTESTAYPKSFDITEALQVHRNNTEWGAYVRELLGSGGFEPPRGGVDVGDHPPIVPVGECPHAVSAECWKIHDLVLRHFLATVSPDAR